MVRRRLISPRKSQQGKTSPPSVVNNSTDGATTSDTEDSDFSQITLESTETPSSSNGSLSTIRMPSVIDVTANIQKRAANDNALKEETGNKQHRFEGVGEILLSSVEDITQSPSQSEDSSRKSTLPRGTEVQTPTVTQAPCFPNSRIQGKCESSVFCRICHEIGTSDIFISPCDCKGSLSLVHKHCLERWLSESNTSICELCGFEYNITRLPRHTLIGSFFAWLFASGNSRTRRILLFDIFTFVILVPLAMKGTSIGMKVVAQDLTMTGIILAYTRFMQLCMIALTISLDAGLMIWAVVRLHYHSLKWYLWYRSNCKVILRGYPQQLQTPQDVPHTSSTTVNREIHF